MYVPAETVVVAKAKVEVPIEFETVICPDVPWRVKNGFWNPLMVVVAGAEKTTVPVAPLKEVTPILVRVIPEVEVVIDIPEPERDMVEVETPANEPMYTVDEERKSLGFFP